jgi:hypothetical protein
MTYVNLDGKNLRVTKKVYLNTSCDRKSHDRLRYGHLKMRHHDTNLMDGMNLDENHLMMVVPMKNLRGCHQKMGDHLMVCQMKI